MIRSLRLRLILLFSGAIVLAAALQCAATFEAATEEANKLFDYHMQRMAQALQQGGFEQEDWYFIQRPNQISFDFVFQVWADDSPRVIQSGVYGILPRQTNPGYSTITLANGAWRVYAVQAGTRTIQVAQKLSTRRDRAISLALHSVWPVFPVSLLLFVAAWWFTGSALQPLNRIGFELAGRGIDSLTPVSETGVPAEVALLVAELNSLLARVSQGVQLQQRFVADAAHELRSPLTALKLQVQTLARARDETARAQAIARLLGGVDRASRLVEQLLALAREEPAAREADPALTVLADCIAQALNDVAPLATMRCIAVHPAELPAIRIAGHADSLQMMIRNLLDNAIRYTPEGGQVAVTLTAQGARAILTIEDSGPGIAAADRARVFDRFYRVPGTSPAGSGLGLAIVKTIADRLHAPVEFHASRFGGLAVLVKFPLVATGGSTRLAGAAVHPAPT